MRRSALRPMAAIVIVIVMATLIACNRARSRGYETGDGIPALPDNVAGANTTGGR